ncbi:YggS family pyridoxal phosphate enzyme [Iodidimonas gelatinilytica]|uniref:Pyridoxal phosphate homeostasis protein n=1 Tax=Iodidimonas gelatinilytica TaxID=1236966 RepID=A0A5A7MNN3_9PROT|nr:YggS family pyridoxal phosphate-dependent enzyme [Iodidimonas gelatinilytica]GEQ97531.1 YggS family pyridoxal phosphate enzyme [Iodidimonas gelatinilytica]GER01566.1 YggS family pyridoxal phosphate enzyme [Iodidimonas gelatinilytica]
MTEPYRPEALAGNLAHISKSIDAAMTEHGLETPRPQVIAVSKRFHADHIRPLLEAGHHVFGENRVQEAQEKWPALKAEFPKTELHLIGQLQSNKAEEAVALFDVIQTVDRPKLARKLKDAVDKLDRHPTFFLQVNTGNEPQKGGAALHDLADLLAYCRDELALDIAGLMCIPPADDDPALHFALLNKLARRHGLAKLSMGMSADYEIAAVMGATYVRVGTAIFGTRPS